MSPEHDPGCKTVRREIEEWSKQFTGVAVILVCKRQTSLLPSPTILAGTKNLGESNIQVNFQILWYCFVLLCFLQIPLKCIKQLGTVNRISSVLLFALSPT